MGRPLISFQMLAYNEEKYIRQAIESVLNQSEPNIELLLVDNASTDNTGKICREYLEKDSRIRFQYNEKNSNLCPEYKPDWLVPSGEYYGTVDADDFLDPDYAKILYCAAKKFDADIAVAGAEIFGYDDPSICVKRIPPAVSTRNVPELSEQFEELYNNLRTSWGKIMKTDFCFQNGTMAFDKPSWFKNAGDTLSSLRFLSKASSFVSIDKPLYHYRYHEGSYYSSSLDFDRIRECNMIFDETRSLFEKWNVMDTKMEGVLCRIHFASMSDFIGIAERAENLSLENRISFLEDIVTDDYFCKYALISKENRDFTFAKIDCAIDKILKNKTRQEATAALKYFTARIHFALKDKQSGGRPAWYIPLMLSSICDSRNKGFWGIDKLIESISAAPVGLQAALLLDTDDLKCLLKFPRVFRHIVNQDFEDAKTEILKNSELPKKLFDFVTEIQNIIPIQKTDLSEKKEHLSESVKNGVFESAVGDLLELMSSRPLDRECLYFSMYLCWQTGNKGLALQTLYACSAFWDDDPDIMALCGDLKTAEGCTEESEQFYKKALEHSIDENFSTDLQRRISDLRLNINF